MNRKTARVNLFFVFIALFIASLACEQSGEIIPDAEATRRAIPTITPTPKIVVSDFNEGDEVVFVGKGYLIPFYKNPGDDSVLSHAARNDSGVILSIVSVDGVVWYEVKSVAGTGWITLEFLQASE